MGWLQLVGSFKLKVSFAKEPYKRDYILQKRPIIYTAQSKHPKQVTRDLYMSEETYIYQTLILHRFLMTKLSQKCIYAHCREQPTTAVSTETYI